MRIGLLEIPKTIFQKKPEEERSGEKVELDNVLFQQIEEFKKSAQQLQEKMVTNESRVEELDTILEEKEKKLQELDTLVEEREEKAQELEALLVEKQEEAENVYGSVERSIDQKVNDQTQFFRDNLMGQRKFVEEATVRQMEQVDSLKARMDALETGVGDKVHDESVKTYRNIQSLYEELNQKVDAMKTSQESGFQRKYLVPILGFWVIGFLAMLFFIFWQAGIFGTMM